MSETVISIQYESKIFFCVKDKNVNNELQITLINSSTTTRNTKKEL